MHVQKLAFLRVLIKCKSAMFSCQGLIALINLFSKISFGVRSLVASGLTNDMFA